MDFEVPITFEIDSEIVSGRGIFQRLRRLLRGNRPMIAVARELDRETQRNLRRGRGPFGPLPPTAKFTRFITNRNENAPTLFVTGSLAASLKYTVSRLKIVYGPTGRHRAIGNLMATGGPSRLKVATSKIKTGQNGRYVRIFNDQSGQWFTKKVSADGTIPITVRARNWLGVSPRMEQKLIEAYKKALKL